MGAGLCCASICGFATAVIFSLGNCCQLPLTLPTPTPYPTLLLLLLLLLTPLQMDLGPYCSTLASCRIDAIWLADGEQDLS